MPVRSHVDACPGALTLHDAADGPLARVRIPGGLIDGRQLATVADLAEEYGGGRLELTSRANLQLRAVRDPSAVADVLAGAGLLPSATHERVRNIVASPLSGLDGSPDITPLVRELDDALCARPSLAALPGRFLFAVDDGRGDVAALGADVTLRPGDRVVDGLSVAEAFLVLRAAQGSSAWRIAELDGGAAALAPHLDPLINSRMYTPGGAFRAVDQPVGVVGSALVVLAPLGRLDVAQARWLAGQASELRISPWRSVVLPGLADPARAADEAAALGLGVDADSPWYRVSACTGRPGCAKALADVQADARAAVTRWPGRNVRWSGCERRCGRPRDTEIDVVATENGYRIV